MDKQITRVWAFQSDSNPTVQYETLQYTDGSTLCNCPSGCRTVAIDGTRSCKHCRYVDVGVLKPQQIKRLGDSRALCRQMLTA